MGSSFFKSPSSIYPLLALIPGHPVVTGQFANGQLWAGINIGCTIPSQLADMGLQGQICSLIALTSYSTVLIV